MKKHTDNGFTFDIKEDHVRKYAHDGKFCTFSGANGGA